MQNDNRSGSFVYFSRAGCLLPSLITLNLLFGWIFLKTLPWLIIEALLILIFIINGYITTRKIISTSSKGRGNVIDVKGEVVEDKHRLK